MSIVNKKTQQLNLMGKEDNSLFVQKPTKTIKKDICNKKTIIKNNNIEIYGIKSNKNDSNIRKFNPRLPPPNKKKQTHDNKNFTLVNNDFPTL